MATVHVYGDEGGDLTFKPPGNGVSRYFLIGTVTLGADCSIGDRLLALRREIAWEGLSLDQFHAADDKQAVRDRVYGLIGDADFRFDVTILDKRKAYEDVARDPVYAYKLAWYLHFKYVAPRIVKPADDLMVVASSLKINRKKIVVARSVRDVVMQVSNASRVRTAFAPAISDPCLQIADYMTWAVQRKYEIGDARSYKLIGSKIMSEFQPFLRGTKVLY
jgi:Protein of unknown function (DUF3800)